MKGFLLSLCLVALFSVGTFAFAQEGLVPCNGVDCEPCHLAVLADNVLDFLIVIAVTLSGIVFAIGGFHWVTSAGDTGKISKGRGLMTNAVVGIIITMAAWLLVDTVLKILLAPGALGMWNAIQCS